MPTWNVGQTLAAAMPKFEKTFKDQVFDETVLLNYLKNNGGIETKDGGANYIQVPVMHATGTSEWFSGTDSLNVTPVDTLDAAQYYWRNLNASIVITLEDELNNTGKEQIIDLLDAKIMQAKLTIADNLNSSLYTGTGAEARKKVVGLQTLVDTGTVGGIAGGTYTDWQAYEENTATALTIGQMKTARNTINQGKGGSPVKFIVTTQTLFEKYESLLTPTYQMDPMVRSKEAERLGDVGFTALSYAGVPISFDLDVPAGEMYFLNADNLKLYVHNMANNKMTESNSPVDQHVAVRHIVMRCALGTNRRKSLGKLTAKTA
jgi:hypothetical protein